MPLTGKQKKELDAALRDAYRTRSALRRMIARECERNLDDFTGTDGLEHVVFELVEEADSDGWIDRLLVGAIVGKPGNLSLRALHDRAWPINDPDLPSRRELESLVEPNLRFVDSDAWFVEGQAMGRRVCRIRASSSTTTLWGTGFLVGPGSILTNCHVVRHVVGQPNPDVTFQFDYRVRPDGSTSDGVTLGPNTGGDGWLVCSSPHSKYDLEVAPTGLPTDEELDYALVRIAGEPGTERGWVDITSAPSAAPDQSLAILQHPDKAPLKLALDTKAILALNGNQTRVTYRTNTIGGSSGSPCFNMDWQPVALHHSGDPAAPDFPATRNQGIPFGAITKHVARHAPAGALPGR